MLCRSDRQQMLAILLCAALSACGREGPSARGHVPGNAHQGAIEIDRVACGSCHIIPGIAGASGLAGPPLDHFGERRMVAGLLPNTPDNLALWIARPQKVLPGNVMPDEGLSAAQARNVAAYLERLQ
jgi:cytochrome c1